MSRIGKLPVVVPAGVTVSTANNEIKVKGPKGELVQGLATGVKLVQEGNHVNVVRQDDERQSRSNHGLTRALLNNMVTGVTKGYERKLLITGVGFKGEIKGKTLVLALGYSHPVEFPFPKGVTIEVDKSTTLIVKGADRQVVGETAAKLRALRSPDSYKGKGVRFENEHVRLKAGKTAKK
ncbi:MAG: 50S ribosomal protein L6 [Deltaproteobacteria bacterium]|nr:50S ribosomal protein L6 [Deltaproteobacteria bacterium]